MKVVHWLVVASLFSASFDTILNFDVGGSLRFCQILMLLVFMAALAHAIQNSRLLWPRGSSSLSLWMLIQLFLIPLGGVLFISVEFYLQLVFMVFCIFALVQIYGQSDLIESLMRMYLLSYVFAALFGLFQFVIPFFGIVSIENAIIRQWIVHGKLARLSGFNYEPSYYATYLVMGWIMLIELRVSKAKITEGKLWKWATIAVTAALFLSTSKTAWIIMIVELGARVFPFAFKSFRRFVHEWLGGRLLAPRVGRHIIRNGAILCVVLLVGAVFISQFIKDPSIFLSGTGIGHQPAHSLNDRSGAAWITLEAFKEHPFVGRSLGGVSVYLASRNGIVVTTLEQAHAYWGFPVLMEVLVASGIFGFIPFLMFLYANTFGALRLASRLWPQERAKWVRALARAMIFEWLVLLGDQNLLRIYIWFHIAMVAVVAYHLEYASAPEFSWEKSPKALPGMGEAVASL
jgi:hypothetical protein